MSQQQNSLFEKFKEDVNGRFSFDSKDMTMVEWMGANTTLNRRNFNTGRYPFQSQILNDMHPNLCCIKPSQVGLALRLSTPILTNTGWETMESLKVGDTVYDETGKPCEVTYKSPTWTDRDCYKITFCTGEEIVCDGSHRWSTNLGVVNTRTLQETHKNKNYTIPCTKPVQFHPHSQSLPVNPYKFGEYAQDISRPIPEVYLTASYNQRVQLVDSLIDFHSQTTRRGRITFDFKNPVMLDSIAALLHSLGFKTRQTRGRLSFLPHEKSSRKIIKVKEVPSEPTQCISVDSPNRLYLCGKGMIPTHNTEGQIRKALAFLMRNQGTSLIYTLPNEMMYSRISDARIRPIVQGDKVFNGPTTIKPIRRRDLMELGRSKLYIAAAIEGTATSIDADAVFVDETDLSDQKMIALLNSRMQNSDWKLKQQFSTPTFPAYGVHQTYEMSDKHVFLRKCGACGHHNDPRFDRKHVHIDGLPSDVEELTDIEAVHIPHINFSNCYVKCSKCNSPLDLKDYSLTEWVATHPSITEYRGYKVTPFSTDRLPPEYIVKQLIQYKSKEFVRGFHNTTLGEAYSDGTMQISHEQIAAAFKDCTPLEPNTGENPVFLGIDVGQICNIVIGKGTSAENMQVIGFRTVPVRKLIDEIDSLFKEYNVVGGLIDRQPYTPKSEEVMHHTKGKILPAQYGNRNSVKLNDFKEVDYYQLDRTGSLDFVHTRMKREDIKFHGYGTYKPTIQVHLRDMVREEGEEKTAVWKKLTNKDHFFHALGYLLAAPEAKELTELKLKEDKRESLIIGGAQLGEPDPHQNLIGYGQTKTVDKIVSSRVLG